VPDARKIKKTYFSICYGKKEELRDLDRVRQTTTLIKGRQQKYQPFFKVFPVNILPFKIQAL